MENRKKSIEELQAELALESEALATLQLIYAEKVKQVRVNTLLPPDIQARFLGEWETFYQQRMAAIFRKDYHLTANPSAEYNMAQPAIPAPVVPAAPIAAPVMPVAAPVVAPQPVAVTPPPAPSVKPMAPPPPAPPAKPMMASPPAPPPPPAMPINQIPVDVLASGNLDSGLSEDILGVNTGSWMNPAESIGYEQYSDSGPISSTLMDSDKAQISNDELDEYNNEDSDSIDGFAATSGLKGLTEFMDFDLKRKKS